MREVRAIVFRYLTDVDFFNMYKPTGTEAGGGGQRYIDFRTSGISVHHWQTFFNQVMDIQQSQVRNGPEWDFPVHSIGVQDTSTVQRLRVYQRREASICIPNQNLNTRSPNRVLAWSPARGFPQPQDPTNRHTLPEGLVVYLVRTYENEVWAGWFLNDVSAPSPCRDTLSTQLLQEMLDGDSSPGDVGFMSFRSNCLLIDETNGAAPFSAQGSGATQGVVDVSTTRHGTRRGSATLGTRAGARIPRILRQRKQRTEDEIAQSLFGEDEDCSTSVEPDVIETVVRVRQRNQKAVRDLKELYEHQCQITGDRFTFLKRNGTPYTEVHHLVPLGSGGADNPRNMIIVSPLIHRMLHYAHVTGINLSQIQEQEDGSASLSIRINGQDYEIRWKPQHAERVLSHQQVASS